MMNPTQHTVWQSLVTALLPLAPALAQEFRVASPVGTVGSVATADFDQSGHPDLLMTNLTGIHLIRDPGLHGIVAPILLSTATLASGLPITIVDADQDGHLDIFFPAYSGTGWELWLIRGAGNGAVLSPRSLGSFGFFFINTFGVGDFNGDGLADIAVLDGANFFMPTAEILIQQPAATFVRSTLQVATDLVVGDFDGDGFSDLIVQGNSAVSVYRGTAAGLQPRAAVAVGSTIGGRQVTDLDGDGLDDLILLQLPGSLVVQWGHPTSFLESPSAPLTTGYTAMPDLHWSDFDLDGNIDIVDRSGSQHLVALRGRGDRQFSSAMSLPLTLNEGRFVDLDEDGDPDYVTRGGERYENLARSGTACGAPVDLTLSTPTPGAPWTLDVDSSVPSTVGGLFFAMASSNTACGTRVDTGTMLAPATLLFTDSNGLASATLPLPSFMIPWPLFVQAIVFDPNGGYSRFGYQLSSSAGRAVRIF